MMLHGLIAMIAVNLQRIPAYNALNLRDGYPLLELRTPQEVIRYEEEWGILRCQAYDVPDPG